MQNKDQNPQNKNTMIPFSPEFLRNCADLIDKYVPISDWNHTHVRGHTVEPHSIVKSLRYAADQMDVVNKMKKAQLVKPNVDK